MPFKIILSGITGRVGGEVLNQSLRDPSISSVIALSRRTLPELEHHEKLEVVVLKDFTQYSDEVIAKLSGADGCIWCMTTTAGDPVLELEYPKAFGNAIAPTLKVHNKRFRYLHLTGAMVERDQSKALWVKGAMRKTKGQGENQMIEFASNPVTNSLWETIIARPGMVMKRGTILGEATTMLSGQFIKSDQLALALIDAVTNGSEHQLLQPSELLKRGSQLLGKQSAIQRQIS